MAEQINTENPQEMEIEKKPLFRRQLVLIAIAALVLVGAIYGLRAYVHARNYEETDDAFIESQIIQLSPKLAGHVLKIYIQDNQQVKQGDLLIELDPRDLQAKLDQARAALQTAEAKQKTAEAGVALTRATTKGGVEQATSGVTAARSGVETANAQVAAARDRVQQAQAAVTVAQANARQAQAQIGSAEAEAKRAKVDTQRYRQLFEKDEISRQRLDQAMAAEQTAEAQLSASRQRSAAAQAQITEAQAAAAVAAANLRQVETTVSQAQAEVGQATGRLTEASAAPQQVAVSQAQAIAASAEIQQAQADVEQAELQLSYTKIYAPADGRVTRKAVEAGSFVQIGQALMALVSNQLWVIANFKETQLNEIRPGQPVEIKVDAYAGRTFPGHVDSIQKGSGSRFSLMPPENATGNFVKVVQRVPVKIVFEAPPNSEFPIGPGMSVVPEVKVR